MQLYKRWEQPLQISLQRIPAGGHCPHLLTGFNTPYHSKAWHTIAIAWYTTQHNTKAYQAIPYHQQAGFNCFPPHSKARGQQPSLLNLQRDNLFSQTLIPVPSYSLLRVQLDTFLQTRSKYILQVELGVWALSQLD